MSIALIRSFLWSIFSRIRTEYGNLISKSQYLVRTREKKGPEKSHILQESLFIIV